MAVPRHAALPLPGPSAVHVWDVALPAARAVPLRELLAGYLGCAPGDVELEAGPQGKPRLRDPAGPRFSVTHSGLRALVAVTREREVGIDLERVRERRNVEALARRWFSERERRHVDARPESDRLAAFYRVWTLKEACVKANGAGLQALTATDVLRPGPRWSATADGAWSARTVEAGDGWAAAVAVEGGSPRPRVVRRRW